MRTKYRFIEGYQGNDTVRGWREYDSIYHAVFADMRGSGGYPKGEAYSTVPQGLLLRPAIPNDENFGLDGDSTYGPKANFKISLRELPDYGRFRVTVTAAKYNDGLLLDPGAAPQNLPDSVDLSRSENPAKRDDSEGRHLPGGHLPARKRRPARRTRRGSAKGLPDHGRSNGDAGRPACRATRSLSILRSARPCRSTRRRRFRVDPSQRCDERRRGRLHGGGLDSPEPAPQGGHCRAGRRRDARLVSGHARQPGTLRFETTGPDNQSNGSRVLPARSHSRQRLAACRGGRKRASRRAARTKRDSTSTATWWRAATIGPANLDNPKVDLRLGRIGAAQPFQGELDEVRLYRRALDEAEIQGLLQPGKQFVQPPAAQPGRRQQEVVTLTWATGNSPARCSNPPSWWCGSKPGRCRSARRTPACGNWTASC